MATRKKPAPRKQFPAGLEVQSLVFDSARFSPREARSWASAHSYAAPAHERMPTTIRLRQKRKTSFVEGTFRTIFLRNGVQAIVALPKRKLAKKRAVKRTVSRTKR